MVGLVIGESTLRILGVVCQHRRAAFARQQSRRDPESERVLCLGDSFTFGVGAEPGGSYPDHLQRLFDAAGPGRVAVINAGRPGYNTSEVLKDLDVNLSKYDPRLVVLLAGCNDNSNFADSNFYLLLNGWPSRLARLDARLSRLLTYKLIRNGALFLRGLRPRTRALGGASSSVPFQGAEPDTPAVAKILVQARRLAGRAATSEATRVLLAGLRSHPSSPSLHTLLAEILLHQVGDNALAAAHLEAARAGDPHNVDILKDLFNAYYRLGDGKGMSGALAALRRECPDDLAVARLVRYGVPSYQDAEGFRALVEYDLGQIIGVCRRRHVTLVLQTYTEYGNWPNSAIVRVARSQEVPLVDNRQLFAGCPDFRRRYYAEDGHLNSQGYRLLAENVHRVIAPLLVAVPPPYVLSSSARCIYASAQPEQP